jgi:hypothetical protein
MSTQLNRLLVCCLRYPATLARKINALLWKWMPPTVSTRCYLPLPATHQSVFLMHAFEENAAIKKTSVINKNNSILRRKRYRFIVRVLQPFSQQTWKKRKAKRREVKKMQISTILSTSIALDTGFQKYFKYFNLVSVRLNLELKITYPRASTSPFEDTVCQRVSCYNITDSCSILGSRTTHAQAQFMWPSPVSQKHSARAIPNNKRRTFASTFLSIHDYNQHSLLYNCTTDEVSWAH